MDHKNRIAAARGPLIHIEEHTISQRHISLRFYLRIFTYFGHVEVERSSLLSPVRPVKALANREKQTMVRTDPYY